MTQIRWHGRDYAVCLDPAQGEDVAVIATRYRKLIAFHSTPEAARKWLMSHSLRKSQARELVAKECHNNAV